MPTGASTSTDRTVPTVRATPSTSAAVNATGGGAHDSVARAEPQGALDRSTGPRGEGLHREPVRSGVRRHPPGLGVDAGEAVARARPGVPRVLREHALDARVGKALREAHPGGDGFVADTGEAIRGPDPGRPVGRRCDRGHPGPRQSGVSRSQRGRHAVADPDPASVRGPNPEVAIRTGTERVDGIRGEVARGGRVEATVQGAEVCRCAGARIREPDPQGTGRIDREGVDEGTGKILERPDGRAAPCLPAPDAVGFGADPEGAIVRLGDGADHHGLGARDERPGTRRLPGVGGVEARQRADPEAACGARSERHNEAVAS